MALYMHVGREGLLALHLYPPPRVCVCDEQIHYTQFLLLCHSVIQHFKHVV